MPPPEPAPPPPARPLLAIVCESLPPYRVHLHRRVAREVPEIRLATLCTHDPADGRWAAADVAELNVVEFGPGQPAARIGKPRYALSEWRKGGRVIAWLRRHRAAAVILHGYNDTGRLRVLRWCRRASVPVFVSGDSNVLEDRPTGLRKLVKRWLVGRVVRQCNGVFPFGRRGAEFFARYGASPDRTYFFPLEPDYRLIESVAPADVEAARGRYHLPEGRRRLIYSGRLVPWKRPDLLIDAFATIASQRPEWDLVVLGDGPEREALEARAAALASRVRWLGGLRDQAAIAAIYRACDVLVIPSDREPWALVINEAAAAGLAIVSSSVPGATAELVRDGVNGRIFEPGDFPGLTQCLLDVTDPARVDRYKSGSAAILASWRARGDPVRGLRAALARNGVIR